MNKSVNSKILIMDSGFGGLSVLKRLREVLPNEDYIYFGDSKNAPYGEKTPLEVLNLAKNVINKINETYDIKAVVIACNTTTVSNLSNLRTEFNDLIFIGTTPNVKEMVDKVKDGELLVISTPITANSLYLKNEIKKYDDRVIKSIPMAGLMNFVEELNFNEKDIFPYLDKTLLPYINGKMKAISLGCTHYPFLKDIIDKYLKKNDVSVRFFDSSNIVSYNLKKELENHNLLSDSILPGELVIYNSINSDDMIEKSFQLLER